GWGLVPHIAGLVFVPLSVAIALLSGPVGVLSQKTGPGPLLSAGSAITGLAYAALAIGMPWGAFWGHIMPSMTLMALGMALVVAPLSAAVMGSASRDQSGAASGINNALSRVAGLVAVAAMGGVAAPAYVHAGGPAALGVTPLDDGIAHRVASNAAFSVVAWITAGLCWLGALVGYFGIGRPAAPRPETA
ncbi:MAG: MFS transporter, partial [Pseudomonadota bacterium]